MHYVQELHGFSTTRSNKVSSPKHITSPHRTKASQFIPSDAYKSRMDREVKSHIVDKENRVEVEPKVMLPFKSHDLKSPPRKIEIYRKRKLYQSQNIAELLLEKGIDYNKYDNTTDHLTGKKAILSLFIFDNTDYEIHSPEQWIEKGTSGDNEEDQKCKISAKALKLRETLSFEHILIPFCCLFVFTLFMKIRVFSVFNCF